LESVVTDGCQSGCGAAVDGAGCWGRAGRGAHRDRLTATGSRVVAVPDREPGPGRRSTRGRGAVRLADGCGAV